MNLRISSVSAPKPILHIEPTKSVATESNHAAAAPDVAAIQKPQKKAPPNAIDGNLQQMFGSRLSNRVNEEQLFTGLVHNRLQKLVGPDAAHAFQEKFQQEMQKNSQGSVEGAALKSLKGLVKDGTISSEQGDRIYSQAFAGAQLDDNHKALFDSKGDTQATAATAQASKKAFDHMAKYDLGLDQAPARSLQQAKPTGGHRRSSLSGSAGSSTAKPSGRGEKPTDPSTLAKPNVNQPTRTGTKIDGPNGFLFKPQSDSTGKLAIHLPKELAGKVDNVVVKDASGKVLDNSSVTGNGNGDRDLFRFKKQGGDYGNNLTIEARLKDGSIRTWAIGDGSARHD